LRARTITLKVRDAGFSTRTRARTLEVATSETAQLHAVVTELLPAVWSAPTPVRLLGVGAAQLQVPGAGAQLDLFASSRSDDAERVADQVREQFGETAITRGALLGGRRPVDRAPSHDDRSAPPEP
jgi:DNA polymerase-4